MSGLIVVVVAVWVTPWSSGSMRTVVVLLATLAVLIGSHVLSMPARKRPASGGEGSVEVSRQSALYRTLVQCGTKRGLVDAVHALGAAGYLVDDALDVDVKRRLQIAATHHANADTPYGKVVQSMPLPSARLRLWQYCNPLALIWYLSSISNSFSDLMDASSTLGVPMRIVIYIDEVCLGNPLRPEKSRTIQSIYWAFVDWPQYILQRTLAWPVFGTIRSTIVETLPGGVSYLMKRVLLTFFPASGDSFATGVTIVRRQGEPHHTPRNI